MKRILPFATKETTIITRASVQKEFIYDINKEA